MGRGASGDRRCGLAGEGGVLASGCDWTGVPAVGSPWASSGSGSGTGLSAGNPLMAAAEARGARVPCGKAR